MSNDLPPLSGPVDASGEPGTAAQRRVSGLVIGLGDTRRIAEFLAAINALRDEDIALAAAAVPSSPAQPRARVLPCFCVLDEFDVIQARCDHHEANRIAVVGAALPPSSPVADSPTTLTLRIATKRNMPAFAGYVAGSVKTGRAEILLNIDALLWASVESDESGEFRRSTIDSLAHEFIHAMEEHFGLLFDEEKVEAAIARVRAAAHKEEER